MRDSVYDLCLSKDTLDEWIVKGINIQNERIDEAIKNNWMDIKARAEGYLEALYQLREINIK
jgi:hypothetical protein